MRNQDVALRLNLSEHTVRNYLIRIFDKLGISSRVQLVLYAFSNTDGSSASEAASYSAYSSVQRSGSMSGRPHRVFRLASGKSLFMTTN